MTKLARLLQESGIESQLEMCPIESVFAKLCHLYLPLRNTIVHSTNTAIIFFHYVSGQSRSRSSTPVSTKLSGPISSSIENQSGLQTGQSVGAVSNVGSDSSEVAGATQTTATQQQQTLPSSRKDYILLCSDERGWLTTWEDLDVSQIRSDRELFELFRSRVNGRNHWTRRFTSLKTIQRISFVKVSNPL
jgi:hypothetical protein